MSKYVFVLDGTGAHHTKLMGFLNQNLNSSDFLFLFCGPCCDPKKIEGTDNAHIIQSFFRAPSNVQKEFSEARKIVVVGFFNVELTFFLLFHKTLRKKTAIALHGGEFYGQRGKTSLKRKAFYALRKMVIKNVEACCTFTTDDYRVAKQFYKLPDRHYLVELPWHFDVLLEQAMEPKPTSPFVVMVGHSALKEDHTLEVLQQLARFRQDEIKIIAPLSYGEDEYRREVLDLGARLFGEKFTPLLEWIEPDVYQKLLQSVSVFVIGTDRQAGTFNINLLLRLGCKVYIRKDTTMWTFFSQECNCELFDISSIQNLDFAEFVDFKEGQRVHNYTNLKERLNEASCLNSWKRVLEIS